MLTGEIRTEPRREQEDNRVVRARTEPQEQEESRVVRRVRSTSPTSLDSRTVSLLCRDGDWSETEPPRASSKTSRLSPTAALPGSQPHQLAQPDDRVEHHQQQQGKPRLPDRGRGRGGGGRRRAPHSLIQRLMLPHSPAPPTRPTASTAAQPKPAHPGGAAAPGQLGLEPRTPAVPQSQHLLHRVERRGRDATSDPSSTLDTRSTSTPRSLQRIWSPDRVDWTQINREAAAAARLQQRIVDRFEEEEQLVSVAPQQQQQSSEGYSSKSRPQNTK